MEDRRKSTRPDIGLRLVVFAGSIFVVSSVFMDILIDVRCLSALVMSTLFTASTSVGEGVFCTGPGTGSGIGSPTGLSHCEGL